MRRQHSVWFFCFILGCGSNELRNSNTVPAQIEIFYQGKPAVSARVVLHPIQEPDPESIRRYRPNGVVQEDGAVSLTSFVKDDGAPVGEYIVTVSLPEKKTVNDRGEESIEGDRLKGRYFNAQKSQLRVTVGPSGASPGRLDLR